MKSPHIYAVFALLFVAFTAGPLHAQQSLSESATATLLTCGPGNDFYTTFGHSAIRITDPKQGIDYVYNYGTFDFDTPNFYWKFMRGQLDYKLSRTSFNRFMDEYEAEGRAVWEQTLNFEKQQLNNLYILLETNLLPEFRYYKYDFFRDNCATRLRDVTYSAWGKDTLLMRKSQPRSFRRLVADNLRDTLEWWRLGIDILFGLPADHRCDANDRMFLPFEMMEEYSQTTTSNGSNRLVKNKNQLLQETRVPPSRSFNPLWVFLLLFGVALMLTCLGCWPSWMDRVLFVTAGLLGLLLCFMWFGTDHYCTAWNLNILWASPLLLLIAVRLNDSPKWALWLQMAGFIVAAVWVLVCGLSPAILFIILTLALRAWACLFPRTLQLRRQPR